MRRYIPHAAAVLAATAGWHLGMYAVRDDLAERQAVGFTGAGEFRFAVFLMLLFGVVAYFLVRRAVLGPKLAREEWSLYRDAGPASVDRAALLERLRSYGYAPIEIPQEAAPPDRFLVRQMGRSHGGVLVDLSNLATGYGTVEATDTRGELHAEMAKYLVYELGKQLPGTRYRGGWSSLSPESTDTLEPQLPDRPHGLR